MEIRPFTENDIEAQLLLCGKTVTSLDHGMHPNKDIDRKLQLQPESFLVGKVSLPRLAAQKLIF